jgi:RNA recognition motif-containing protein
MSFHNNKLYVRNANDERALVEYFKQFGALERVVMKPGFAFVQFRQPNDCAAALRSDTRPLINGVRTQISYAVQEQQQHRSQSTPAVCECGESLVGLEGVQLNRHRTSDEFNVACAKCSIVPCLTSFRSFLFSFFFFLLANSHKQFVLNDNVLLQRQVSSATSARLDARLLLDASRAINQYYERHRPTESHLSHRKRCQAHLESLAQALFGADCRVQMFGSSASGLFLQHSDIDFTLLVPENVRQLVISNNNNNNNNNAAISQNGNSHDDDDNDVVVDHHHDDNDNDNDDDNDDNDDDDDDDDDDDSEAEDERHILARETLEREIDEKLLEQLYRELRRRERRFLFCFRKQSE